MLFDAVDSLTCTKSSTKSTGPGHAEDLNSVKGLTCARSGTIEASSARVKLRKSRDEPSWVGSNIGDDNPQHAKLKTEVEDSERVKLCSRSRALRCKESRTSRGDLDCAEDRKDIEKLT